MIKFPECLLALRPRALKKSSGASSSISLTDLLVPVLQTQAKGWPLPQAHSCLYSLPEAFYYSVTTNKANQAAECRVQLQFMNEEGQDLRRPEAGCLGGWKKAVKAAKAKLSIVGFYGTTQLLEVVEGFRLEVGQLRLARHSSLGVSCSSDLVKFEDKGLKAEVSANYNGGDCVVKLHLPYGFATRLQFKMASYSPNAGK